MMTTPELNLEALIEKLPRDRWRLHAGQIQRRRDEELSVYGGTLVELRQQITNLGCPNPDEATLETRYDDREERHLLYGSWWVDATEAEARTEHRTSEDARSRRARAVEAEDRRLAADLRRRRPELFA